MFAEAVADFGDCSRNLLRDAFGQSDRNTVKRDTKRRCHQFAQSDPETRILSFDIDPAFKNRVVVGKCKGVEELQVVVKKAVIAVSGDGNLVVHHTADSAELVDDGEAVQLVYDVLTVSAVGHKVEALPVVRDGVVVQVELHAVSHDIERDVIGAHSLPEVAGFTSTFTTSIGTRSEHPHVTVSANKVLVSEVANTARNVSIGFLNEQQISMAHAHKGESK